MKIKIRNLVIALAAAATAAMSVFVASPVAVQATQNDYPANLATAAQDSVVDQWGYYNRECVSFSAWRMSRDGQTGESNLGNAYQWWGAASTAGDAEGSKPQVGSIMYFPANSYGAGSNGHVAYVYQVNSNNTVNVEEYNWSVVGGYDTRTNVALTNQFIWLPKAGIGVWRSGQWYLRYSQNSGSSEIPDSNGFSFGNTTDTPIVGDWSGQGFRTQGVFRSGSWYLSNTYGGSTDVPYSFGQSGDTPVPMQYSGSSVTMPALYRSSNNTWYYYNGSSYQLNGMTSTDIPVAGDWRGQGYETPGFFRPSTGVWYLFDCYGTSSCNASQSYTYGQNGDTPFVGKWSTNGLSYPGVDRSGTMYLSNVNVPAFAYGNAGDTPLGGVWS